MMMNSLVDQYKHDDNKYDVNKLTSVVHDQKRQQYPFQNRVSKYIIVEYK